MAKYLITTLVLAAYALADDTSAYAAPQGGYAAPSTAYAPSAPAGYGAPDAGYGAPAAEYTSDSYEQPYDSYEAAADDGGDLFDLSKILELLPLFLAVFAAIIVAQLFAPLLGVLFGAKVGLLGGILGPLGGIKITAINAILAPFSLALCNVGPPLTLAGMRRSSASGFELNKDVVDNAANFLFKAIQGEWQPTLYHALWPDNNYNFFFFQSTEHTRQAYIIYNLKSDSNNSRFTYPLLLSIGILLCQSQTHQDISCSIVAISPKANRAH